MNKKTIIIMLLSILLGAFAISCSQDVASSAANAVTAVSFGAGEVQSRNLDVENEQYEYKSYDELYWQYTAVKQDHPEYSQGATAEFVDVNGGEPGFPDHITFSRGNWVFTFRAYSDSAKSVLYFGEASTDVVLLNQDTQYVQVPVGEFMQASGDATILVKNVYTPYKDADGGNVVHGTDDYSATLELFDGTVTDTSAATPLLTVSDNTDVFGDTGYSITGYTDESGAETALTSGYYVLKVTIYTKSEGVVSTDFQTYETTKFYVRAGKTTTVSGNINDVGTDVIFTYVDDTEDLAALIQQASNGAVIYISKSATLDSLTIDKDITIVSKSSAGTALTVTNGLTVNGNVFLSNIDITGGITVEGGDLSLEKSEVDSVILNSADTTLSLTESKIGSLTVNQNATINGDAASSVTSYAVRDNATVNKEGDIVLPEPTIIKSSSVVNEQTGETYSSISDAVAAASSGDTITINALSEEDASKGLTITEPLTITATSEAAAAFTESVVVAESVGDGAVTISGFELSSLEVNGGNVTLDGSNATAVTVTSGALSASSATINQLNVAGNIDLTTDANSTITAGTVTSGSIKATDETTYQALSEGILAETITGLQAANVTQTTVYNAYTDAFASDAFVTNDTLAIITDIQDESAVIEILVPITFTSFGTEQKRFAGALKFKDWGLYSESRVTNVSIGTLGVI